MKRKSARLQETVVSSIHAALWMVALAACTEPQTERRDGGSDGAATEVDAGSERMPDAGHRADPDAGPRCEAPVGAAFGACATGATCDSDALRCEPPRAVPLTTVLPNGSPGPSIEGPAFTQSMCVDECDPTREDECGDCGVCTSFFALSRGYGFGVVTRAGQLLHMCRARCNPDIEPRGGCRTGYACEPFARLCVEECISDLQCRVVERDPDRDGVPDRTFDPSHPAVCNRISGLCDVTGFEGATAGEPCESEVECRPNGLCLRDPRRFPAGYCTVPNCDLASFACGEGEACDRRAQLIRIPACAKACRVGADDANAVIGVDGRGAGCPAGFACSWDGTSSVGAPLNGVCVPGNYNALDEPNVGAPCERDSECWSPFGQGRCLGTAQSPFGVGTCAVRDCVAEPVGGLLPGVAVQSVCPGSLRCAEGEAESACRRPCEGPEDCDPFTACTEQLADGTRVCSWRCASSADCGHDQRCVDRRGMPCREGEACQCVTPPEEG